MNHDTPFIATLKVLASWFLVGISQMSPLQFVQFIAAILAVIFTGMQIVNQIRSWMHKRKERHANHQ